jgi:hypothetical protein
MASELINNTIGIRLDREDTMSVKVKGKRVLVGPKRRGSIPHSDVLKAIRKVAAARRNQRQQPVSDGSK